MEIGLSNFSNINETISMAAIYHSLSDESPVFAKTVVNNLVNRLQIGKDLSKKLQILEISLTTSKSHGSSFDKYNLSTDKKYSSLFSRTDGLYPKQILKDFKLPSFLLRFSLSFNDDIKISHKCDHVDFGKQYLSFLK